MQARELSGALRTRDDRHDSSLVDLFHTYTGRGPSNHFDSAISNTKAGMVDIGLWSNKGFASEIFILIELCESSCSTALFVG